MLVDSLNSSQSVGSEGDCFGLDLDGEGKDESERRAPRQTIHDVTYHVVVVQIAQPELCQLQILLQG